MRATYKYIEGGSCIMEAKVSYPEELQERTGLKDPRDEQTAELVSSELSPRISSMREAYRRFGSASEEDLQKATEALSDEEAVVLAALLKNMESHSSEIDVFMKVVEILSTAHAKSRGQAADGQVEEKTAKEGIGQVPIIQFEDVVVLVKESKIQWDMRKLDLSYDDLLLHYDKEGLDKERIIAAHEEHLESLHYIKQFFSEEQIISRKDRLHHPHYKQWIDEGRPVLLLGGDDNLKEGTHRINNNLIIAVNSAPKSSNGVLIPFTPQDLPRLFGYLEQGDYRVEEWQRLRTKVNGQELPLCASELYIGEEQARLGSRSTIRYRGQEIATKGSGLIIASGAGSTGWFRSAGRYLFPDGQNIWARTAPYAEFVVREPYGDLGEKDILSGSLLPGEEIEIFSSHNNHGEVSVDSVFNVPFPRGARATVSLAEDRPLHMIQFPKEEESYDG